MFLSPHWTPTECCRLLSWRCKRETMHGKKIFSDGHEWAVGIAFVLFAIAGNVRANSSNPKATNEATHSNVVTHPVETVTSVKSHAGVDECQVSPVIHVLQYPGCVPKPIPSFACMGRCSSYLQVSGSKIWQMERSCMCCQESGEREAIVYLFCPKAKPGEKKFRKVQTKAPLECMCRPCTGVEESSIVPQEIAGYADEGALSHFRTSQ